MRQIFVFIVLTATTHASNNARMKNWNSLQAETRSQFSTIDAAGCGQRPLPDNGIQELNTRVVGGFESIPNSWPSICSLRYIAYPNSHSCGANLIKNLDGTYFMLTAAHCVQNDPSADHYFAYCGIHSTVNSNETYKVRVNFTALYSHYWFNRHTMDYDVAIFQISSHVPTSRFISPVCLPNDDWLDGETAIVAGWGSLYPETSQSRVLHQVTLPVMAQETCQSMYGSSMITDRMFCAGLLAGGVDACDGDSGGPLYAYRNNTWTIIGIVSWGYGCADPGYTSVYTDVMVVKSWINDVLNDPSHPVVG
ncbi:Trypsin-7 [Bulinus truncatus]|nr:Trypsin-7 [Bulinus truncatus]